MRKSLTFVAALLLTVGFITAAQHFDWERAAVDAQVPGREAPYRFRVEIDGIDAGQFAEVSGLGAEIEVVEYRDGEDPLTRKRPGRVKYGDITLKKGYVAGDNSLFDWVREFETGEGTRRNVRLILSDREGRDVQAWNLFECFPKSWKAPSQLNQNAVFAIEKIEIAVEKVERIVR